MPTNNKRTYFQLSSALTAGLPLIGADRQFDALAWSVYFCSRVYVNLYPKMFVLLTVATRPMTVLEWVDSRFRLNETNL